MPEVFLMMNYFVLGWWICTLPKSNYFNSTLDSILKESSTLSSVLCATEQCELGYLTREVKERLAELAQVPLRASLGSQLMHSPLTLACIHIPRGCSNPSTLQIKNLDRGPFRQQLMDISSCTLLLGSKNALPGSTWISNSSELVISSNQNWVRMLPQLITQMSEITVV